ncbi:MAG: hypothetical protein A3G34_09150 [Candidatus Lindowbacteria bacterium RIFCSPLOWO2_12_FULL_62_27]|nr:MAG: hypothetical protein A3G34_09150 [Candidatus Lindowbacteria bacterium RIFCSPLOWO2_12_FULL_62_27]
MLFLGGQGAEAVLVTFKHADAGAKKVTVAGEFNNWDKTADEMQKNLAGEWVLQKDLNPGRYEYKFVVDGNEDKANKDNRTVNVKADQTPAAAGMTLLPELPVSAVPASLPERPTSLSDGGQGRLTSVSPPVAPVTKAEILPVKVVMPPVSKVEVPRVAPVIAAAKVEQPAVAPVIAKESPHPSLPPQGGKGLTAGSPALGAAKGIARRTSSPAVQPSPRASPGIPAAADLGPVIGPAKGLARRKEPPKMIASVKPVALSQKVPAPAPVPLPVAPKQKAPSVSPPLPERPTSLSDGGQGRLTSVSPPRPDVRLPEVAPKEIRDLVRRAASLDSPAGPSFSAAVADSAGLVDVQFRYRDPNAILVGVGGEFNRWDWKAARMKKGPDGVWTIRLRLSPGEYAYKFVVEGDWVEDPENPLKKAVDGTQNSLIRVGMAVVVAELLPPAPAPAPTPVSVTPRPETVPTVFSHTDMKAKKVTLAGEFNQWNPAALEMKKSGADDGKWEVAVDLKPGQYEYKFVVDGDWDKANKDNRTVTVAAPEGGAGVVAAPAGAPAPTTAAPHRPETKQVRAAAQVPEVTFKYKAPDAKKVGVGGEFNNWKWEDGLMDKGSDGVWTRTMRLDPGEYAYKIVVDGDWRLDPENPLKKEVGGNSNSLARVTGPTPAELANKDGLTPGVHMLPNGQVMFAYQDMWAEQVYLAGSFNNWVPDAWPMMKRPDGLWVSTLKLRPGTYTYKYYVDGVGKLDPENPDRLDAGFGPDSMIKVEILRLRDIKVPWTFRIEAPKARRVTLAGDFNNWDPNGIELRRKGGGWWETMVDLPVGRYEYKYVEDGDWNSLNRDKPGNKWSVEVK